uniref:Uncharacterized protein n=1 Tax=Anguilla anguilla TaxID=7936 RepID=A0A0E9UM74_ANGAN
MWNKMVYCLGYILGQWFSNSVVHFCLLLSFQPQMQS